MMIATTTAATEIVRAKSKAGEELAAFDRAPVGMAWATLDALASASVETLHRTARAALFPDAFTSTAPAVLAHFEFVQREHPHSSFAAFVIDAHARSLDTFPELALFVRSGEVRQRLRAYSSERFARRGASKPDHDAEVEIATVETALASHLVGIEAYEPAASSLAVDVPALRARLASIRQRHEEFARSEAERLMAERVAEEEAFAAADRDRRQGVAAFFSARGSRAFNTATGRVISGAGLASIALENYATDMLDGRRAIASIEELERIRLETEAAEAAQPLPAGE